MIVLECNECVISIDTFLNTLKKGYLEDRHYMIALLANHGPFGVNREETSILPFVGCDEQFG
jgi:hypothetical protein